MIVFSVFFGSVAGLAKDTHSPYPLMLFCGLLPWTLFTGALQSSSNSLVGNERLVSKVYFPRLIIPTSAMLARLVDFFISFGVLVAMLAYYGLRKDSDPLHPFDLHRAFTPALLMLPVFILVSLVTALAMGLWLSAINVRFRDVGYMLPFALQLLVVITPVYYESALVQHHRHWWSFVYSMNPMTCVVDGFRSALLGDHPPHWPAFYVSMSCVLVVLFTGLIYFRRAENTFADVI